MRTQEKIKQTCKIAEQMHFLKLQFQGSKIFSGLYFHNDG